MINQNWYVNSSPNLHAYRLFDGLLQNKRENEGPVTKKKPTLLDKVV
ncbi:MAG: hypothetical protein AAFQ98_26035 [Bacteroidota bacterium]